MKKPSQAQINTRADFVKTVLKDLMCEVSVHEFARSFVIPAEELLRLKEGVKRLHNTKLKTEDIPDFVWNKICMRHRRAVSFPLGPVAQRAVKRTIGAFIRSDKRDNSPILPLSDVIKKVETLSAGRIIQIFLTYWLFEAAMLNFRGSSEHLNLDFGFWYHWSSRGQWRDLREEAKMRREIFLQCRTLASKLLEEWKKLAPPTRSCPRRLDMAQVLEQVLDDTLFVPVQSQPTQRHLPAPVTVLGAIPDKPMQTEVGPIAYDACPIILEGKNANIKADLSELYACCNNKVHSLLQDLIDIAITVYFADIYVPRDKEFKRDLVFLMPVRHRDVWRKEAKLLVDIVGFLTGNFVEFRFIPSLTRSAEPLKKFEVHASEKCVALFSGGFDSFVGATKLAEAGRTPFYISHSAFPILRSLQRKLVQAIHPTEGKGTSVTVFTTADKAAQKKFQLGSPPEQELYQYGRSFLFLSLAAVAALENGIEEIFVHENGPVSLNPSFSEARFNTKTTHPVFLRAFRKLIYSLVGAQLQITNPFELLTKGEMLQSLDKQWIPSLSMTSSCWSYARVPAWAKRFGVKNFDGRHCGRCLPCIWRRAAFQHAGLEHADDLYLSDKISSSDWATWLTRERMTVMLDQFRFSCNALVRPDKALLDLCPDFYAPSPASLQERLTMYRHFSQEVLSWFDKYPNVFRYTFRN